MATTAAAPAYVAPRTKEKTGLWSWLTTTDHKRIAILYLYSSLFFFLVGGLEAILIRAQLMLPNGEILNAELFNQLMTMHGTTMIFLAVMPLSAAFFNFLIPLQIGARDVAFPRLNAFSYWVYLLGGIFITVPIFFLLAPNGGWFGYAPLTTNTYSPGLNIDFWVLGLQILGVSSLAAAFNFISTVINLRAPGMTMMRVPIFTWMAFVVQFLLALAFPAITVALVFLQFDRFFGGQFYSIAAGADPLLWQHLFWIFGHPEVYILILPAFGLVSEVLPVFSRKPLFGYPVMVYSGVLIGFLGFGVWAHHMFGVGMGPIGDTVFSLMTFLIAIPTGVKIFNWVSTMWGGQLRFPTQMLFAIGLVALFTIGGISGVMHASPPADLHQTDTYFVVAHFHYVLFGGSIFGLFAGIYHYFPKMFGRLLDDRLGKVHFWLYFIGMNVTFFPMHYAGLLGMPRRIYQFDAGQGIDVFNLLASIGAYTLAIGTLVFVYNFFKSRASGAIAPADPWGAPTVDWAIPSPPPDYNYAQLPTITSRYPMWEVSGTPGIPLPPEKQASSTYPTAEELGIPMPNPSIMPFIVAFGIVVFFGGSIVLNLESNVPGIVTMVTGGLIILFGMWNWLLTPLEDAH